MLSNFESIFPFFFLFFCFFADLPKKKRTNNNINRKSDRNENTAPLAMSQQTDTKFITRKKKPAIDWVSKQMNVHTNKKCKNDRDTKAIKWQKLEFEKKNYTDIMKLTEKINTQQISVNMLSNFDNCLLISCN